MRNSTIKPSKPRRKKCKQCGNTFLPTKPIQPRCGFVCDVNHRNEEAEKKEEARKLKKPKPKKIAKRPPAKKIKAKSDNDYPHQFDLTKVVVQRWVATVRDAGKGCISCGANDETLCAGHYRTAGGNPEIALDTRNIHIQCFNCNSVLSGNINGKGSTHGYKKGLIARYGQAALDWLDGYHKPKNYTSEQLKQIRNYYLRMIRSNNKDDSKSIYKK